MPPVPDATIWLMYVDNIHDRELPVAPTWLQVLHLWPSD